MSTSPSLSLLQKLDMAPGIISILIAAIYTAACWPFIGANGAATFDRHMQNGITRQLAGRFSVQQLQFIRGTTPAAFAKWVKLHREVATHSEAVVNGTSLHWIGDRDAQKIIFHIHGGGYVLPLSVGHLSLMEDLRQNVSQATGVSVAVAFVQYSLAPYESYPTQFREVNAALQHLLGQGVSPKNIILSGDSAGAHILFCAISHILHPHPDIPAPPRIPTKFGGLLLVSPRVSNATSAASFSQNTHRDTLTRETFQYWFANSRANGPIATDEGLKRDGYYTEPVEASAAWWDGLSRDIVSEVFVSAGEHECMRDDIIRFVESWKSLPGVNVTFELEERGIHNSPLMDVHRGPSDLMRAIQAWLKTRVETA